MPPLQSNKAVKRIISASLDDVQWHNALTSPPRSHDGVNAFNLCYILTLLGGIQGITSPANQKFPLLSRDRVVDVYVVASTFDNKMIFSSNSISNVQV